MRCPVCSNRSKLLSVLDSNKIKSSLSRHFNKTISQEVEIVDYELRKCDICTFEFANPQIEGSSSFYNWITLQEGYYPIDRWEYHKVKNLISKSIDAKLLDVGCGDGIFFDVLSRNLDINIDFMGVDPTQESINKCFQKGYKAYCMDIETFKQNYPNQLFDYITSFHCLEHIGDPKKFIEDLSNLLNKSGCLYISTPYSPMTIEIDWFDILNHPPHHMGRWNKKSYEAVATSLGLNVEFFAGESGGILALTMESFLMSELDMVFSRINNPRIRLFKAAIRKPLKFIKHLYKQTFREKLSGSRAPNVVLVKFTKK